MIATSRAKVVVYVRGGLVEDVVADGNDVDVMVVDYDNEKTFGQLERQFLPVRCDAELIERTCNGIEGD